MPPAAETSIASSIMSFSDFEEDLIGDLTKDNGGNNSNKKSKKSSKCYNFYKMATHTRIVS